MNSTHTPIKLLLICLLFVVFALSASACGSNNSSDHGDMQMSSNDMPDYVQQSPPRVREAYEFAVENPFALEFQPCYCGCGAMGHLNNQDCFVKEIQPNGEVVYDNHAAGCGICVDIAQDVMRLAEDGKTPLEIRTYIDSYYSQFGPSTDTEMPLS
jgi:hypothetical protein